MTSSKALRSSLFLFILLGLAHYSPLSCLAPWSHILYPPPPMLVNIPYQCGYNFMGAIMGKISFVQRIQNILFVD